MIPQTINIVTKEGNTLQFFYNAENNLVVVDLVAGNENGGTELFRQTLNEARMLEHCK
jgi:hypothetical protein